jgi:hypothetical protein
MEVIICPGYKLTHLIDEQTNTGPRQQGSHDIYPTIGEDQREQCGTEEEQSTPEYVGDVQFFSLDLRISCEFEEKPRQCYRSGEAKKGEEQVAFTPLTADRFTNTTDVSIDDGYSLLNPYRL